MASVDIICSEQASAAVSPTETTRTLLRYMAENEQEGQQTDPLLASNGLDDFLKHGPQDTIFEEYDSRQSQTPQDWKSQRPSIFKSIVHSSWVVLRATFWGGIVLGLLGVLLFYIDINTASYCHWMPNKTLQKLRMSVRVAGKALEGFLIEFWQFLLLWFTFGWPLLKEVNLLAITILIAFVDVSYRLLLHVFHGYKSPWIPYPLNFLFAFMILYSSYVVARRSFPESKSKALTLAFKLCVQFLFGMPVSYLLNYVAFPWFARTPPGFERAAIAALAPMIMVPAKIISRQCAIQLKGVNHPGTSHAIVSAAYGASSIVFRTLQAGMESFWLFTGLSIGSGVFYVIERLTVPLRDKFWRKLGLSCCCCFSCRGCRNSQTNLASPPYRRLTADISIQGMLFEPVSIVFSIGVLYLYYLVYGISANKWAVFRFEVSQRILTALAVEFVFNSIAVLLQVRYFNIPIVRVWRHKWRKHLHLTFITTILSVVYFTEYMLQFIRAVYENDENFTVMKNCTKPFHFFPTDPNSTQVNAPGHWL